MSVNRRLNVLGEIGIRYQSIAEPALVCLRKSDAFADYPSWALWRLDYSDWTTVVLNDDLQALLHFGQYAVQVPREFPFGDVDASHVLKHSTFLQVPTDSTDFLERRL
jgi:hypothetical protein